MFSYRHGFHAGNHADVLKHLVWVQLLAYMARKDKPFWAIDTHAGAGVYDLHSGFAAQRGEYRSGIARLWQAGDPPAAVADLLREVRRLNPDGQLRHYPGSPQLALQMLRPGDRLRLFELHSTEGRQLARHYEGQRQVQVETLDGYAGLKACLPPMPRRAVVLIDPPYEDKKDYRRVITALRDAKERFATGTYAVWYPQVVRLEAHEFPAQLRRLGGDSWLHATLSVKAPARDGIGLHGSGLFVLNPPYTLLAALQDSLPWLHRQLDQDGQGGWAVEGEVA